MIDGEVARSGLAALASAAVMLIEDAHPLLIKSPRSRDAGAASAASLGSLVADLAALGAAMAVLARSADDAAEPCVVAR